MCTLALIFFTSVNNFFSRQLCMDVKTFTKRGLLVLRSNIEFRSVAFDSRNLNSSNSQSHKLTFDRYHQHRPSSPDFEADNLNQHTMVHSTTPHPELQTIRSKLSDILKSITAFGPGVTRPPVIDASIEVSGEVSDDVTTQQQTLPGLRALRDAVKRDLDVLEKIIIHSHSCCFSLD